MATLPPNFNADEIEIDDFSPLPDGDYVVTIVGSELKETKNGRGKFLELQLKVRDGDFAGRTTKDRLNLQNDSPDAVRIANQTLAKICKAVGVLKPRDSVDLHNIPMVAVIAMDPPDQRGKVFNSVKNYTPKSAGSPPANGATQANDSPPYNRKQW